MITRRMNLRAGRCPEDKKRVGGEKALSRKKGRIIIRLTMGKPAAAKVWELNHSRLVPAVAVVGTARYYSVRAHQSGRL